MTGLGFNARRRALVTVIAAIALVSGAAATVMAFDDVPDGSYFEDAVAWTDDQDIANGRPSGLFDPFADVTRGELVTMLWRLAGEPDADPPTFTDVPGGAFFEEPVGWAEDIALTTGVGGGKFAPYASTKRSEVVTFLWRYACRPAETAGHGFSDVVVGSFYELAVKWAKAQSITTGTTATTFDPNGTTDRAQAATFIWRLAGMPDIGDPGGNRTTGLPTCNTAPVLDGIGDQSVDELVELAFTATATDTDVPADTLTFTLDDGASGAVPAGAAITTGGAFTWTPTETDGGTTATFDIVVTDNGDPAMEDRETITITVDDTNTSPVLNAIGAKAAAEAVELAFTATATDTDVPADTLTFTLEDGPGTVPIGAAITAGGDFTWTPDESQDGAHTFDVVVTDDGDPAMEDRETITVTVGEGNTSPTDPDEGTFAAPAYTAVGNTQLRVTGGTAAASGLATTTSTTDVLTGAADPDIPAQTLAVTAATGTSAEGGDFEVFADGTFTYVSAPGFAGVDSIAYEVCDDFVTPGCDNSTAYISVVDTVFYVDERTGDDGSGDGTSVAPFASLTPLSTGGSADTDDEPGDTIYVVDPADDVITGGIVLEEGQSLLGQGVDLVVNATTLISAVDNPTIEALSGPGITLATNNTVRGLDVNAPGGKGIVDSGAGGVGTLTINNVDTVSTTNNTAVDIEGPGTSTVTIGAVTATNSGGVRIGNQDNGSTFTFASITSTGSNGDGVNIFGVNSASPGDSTISLGTVTVTKTGAGNDGIHVLNSLQTPVSSTGGTISVGDASGLSMTNGHFELTLTSVSSDGGSTPGIDLKNQEGTITITGDGGPVDWDGSGGTIANKTGAGIELEGTKGLTFTELDITTVAGHGIDSIDPRSGPNVFRGGVISAVTGGSNAINIVAAKSSNVVIDQMDLDGDGAGNDGINIDVAATGSLNIDITNSTLDAFPGDGIDIDANDTSDITISGNTIGGTTPVSGQGLLIDADATGTTDLDVAVFIISNTINNSAATPTIELLGRVTGTGSTDLQTSVSFNTIGNAGAGTELEVHAQTLNSTVCTDVSTNLFAAASIADLIENPLALLDVVQVSEAAMEALNGSVDVVQTGTPNFTFAGTCTLPS